MINIILVTLVLIVIITIILAIKIIIFDTRCTYFSKIVSVTAFAILALFLAYSTLNIVQPQIFNGYPQIGETWQLETDDPFENNLTAIIVDIKQGYVAYVYDYKYNEYIKKDKQKAIADIKSMKETQFVHVYKLIKGK